MVMSRDQGAIRSHKLKIDNKSFEREKQFKYLGTVLTDKNSIQEKIKSRFKSENIYYNSVQNILSSSLLSIKNSKMYGAIILSVLLYGCETWSIKLREEPRLSVLENRMLRRILGLKRVWVTEE